MAASERSTHNTTGNWKVDVGWEQIDKWYNEAGGWTTNGGSITMDIIRGRCLEICGSAPSKGTLSPHFNKSVQAKQIARQNNTRNTWEGKLQRGIYALREKSRKHTENPSTKQTNNYENWEAKFYSSLKDFRRNAAGGSRRK